MTRRNNRNQRNTAQLRFDEKLILNQWILDLFEVESFDKLAEDLKRLEDEGFDENNVSHFHHILTGHERLFEREHLSTDILLNYDQNIVRHWKAITEKRNRDSGRQLYPKYFQYLALLFTEIYLDRYFQDKDALLTELNRRVEQFNQNKVAADQIKWFEKKHLNKIAFWMATGSGKTLLMHINYLQYFHYLNLYGKRNQINRIILLTPNEGLSKQHKDEFDLSGIPSEIFSKEQMSLFVGQQIEIIDIHKLKDESGDKTVAVEAFEDNNLVLVDEGHRGASGSDKGQWMKKRNQICENGFSFEYSATFGQAIKSDKELTQTYARCILFDYSYKYFYKDGYGKEYRILNLQDDSDEAIRNKYLIACLLVFYQQQKIYQENEKSFLKYLLERPLWIFVGGSVNAVRTENKRDVSDVVDILWFLADFVNTQNRTKVIEILSQFKKNQSGLLDNHGNDLFSGTFSYLIEQRLSGEQLYEDIIKILFNAPQPAILHADVLKGIEGEMGLRLGDNEYFGVINVGDIGKLKNLCEDKLQDRVVVGEKEFNNSLFQNINTKHSPINILIGSKKFTEGWNSWRVSTMGLMNIGRTEGSEIIQLFGRGVRLKGIDYCLKRSHRIVGHTPPAYVNRLETLNIFGIRADYMKQFKEYLEDEGIKADNEYEEIILPVIKNLGMKKLRTIRLKEGIDFKRQGPKPSLGFPDEKWKRHRIILDWYPKIQALESRRGQVLYDQADKHEAHFENMHLAFIDINEIYFTLQEYKNERNWFNFNLSKDSIKKLLLSKTWYSLLIPKEEMTLRTFRQVKHWQEIAISLLKKYCEWFYKQHKAAWENQHLEYQILTEDDPNFINEYRLLIEESRDDIIEHLKEIQENLKNGKLEDYPFQGFSSVCFDKHLYQPLLYVSNEFIQVRPIALNEGEHSFVSDLRDFCIKHKDYFEDKELYLLRNLSRGKGIGFFEAGNFYPDFILWLLTKNQQHITFVDPKGLRNIDGLYDPKISFHKTIKELQARLDEPSMVLNSFILSQTSLPEISWWNEGMTLEEFGNHNVLFPVDQRNSYIQKMIFSLS